MFPANSETKCCQLPACVKPVAVNHRGRPAKFCSPAHKLRAWRIAHAELGAIEVGKPEFYTERDRLASGQVSLKNKTEREHTSLDFDATPVPSFDFPSRLSLSFDHAVRRGVRA